jgi:hypothetical protein
VQDVPVPVQHQRRVGPLLAQHQVEGSPHLRELRGVEARLPVDRRVAGRPEQVVPPAGRDVGARATDHDRAGRSHGRGGHPGAAAGHLGRVPRHPGAGGHARARGRRAAGPGRAAHPSAGP